jgi:hypothetical protein
LFALPNETLMVTQAATDFTVAVRLYQHQQHRVFSSVQFSSTHRQIRRNNKTRQPHGAKGLVQQKSKKKKKKKKKH